MRLPWLRAMVLAGALAMGAAAAEHEGKEGPDLGKWKTANFAILAGLLGFVIYKKGGAFFRGRTAEIQRDLKESAEIQANAERKYADVERRLAQLEAEVAGLREQAQDESRAEGERIRAEGRRELEKIAAQAEQEIASQAKGARQTLRAEAAELAIQLAGMKIRQRLTPESDRAMVDSMVHELEKRPEAN